MIVKFHIVPEIGEHVPTVEITNDYQWRWRCDCGARGRVQGQHPDVSVFGWFAHVWKAEGKVWPRDAGPAYVWLNEERAAEAAAREARKLKRLAR